MDYAEMSDAFRVAIVSAVWSAIDDGETGFADLCDLEDVGAMLLMGGEL